MNEKKFQIGNVSTKRASTGDSFQSLPGFNCQISHQQLRIAIVTPEIVGPSHGGVGTAYHSLALALSENNNHVTILFTPLEPPSKEMFLNWKRSYKDLNINLELLPHTDPSKYFSLWTNAKRSYHVMEWLLAHDPYDFVHFPDGKGLGFFAIRAKYQAINFSNTKFVVGAHSTTFWDASFSFGEKTYYQDYLERAFIESECARLCDYLISPSQFHLDWMKNQAHWNLSCNSYVQPNIMRGSTFMKGAIQSELKDKNTRTSVNELVFFGRLERRKGLVLLCDALDQQNIRNRSDFSLTFLGHAAFIDGKSAIEYLKERSKNWKFSWTILPRKERDEALLYLKQPGRIALIPSLSETMSFTVLECLWAGIPFLAAKAGAIPELINSIDLDQVTFEPTPLSLAKSIERVLKEGGKTANASFNIEEKNKNWVDWHQLAFSTPEACTKPVITEPLISVCLINNKDEKFKPEFLKSIFEQSYKNIEIILVKSDQEEIKSNESLNKINFIFKESHDVFEKYNLSASIAKGEFILFLESSLILEPDGIRQLNSIIQTTNSDILTFAVKYIDSHEYLNSSIGKITNEKIRFYLGNSFSLGALHNVFGGKSFLVRTDVFKRLGGLSAEGMNGDYLWDFYLRASLESYIIESVTVPLGKIRYEKEENITENYSGKFIYNHRYLDRIPVRFHEMFHFIQATRFFHDPSPDGSFEEGFVNRPQVFVDEFWNSRLWKIYLPWGNRINKLLKLPEYVHPKVKTLTEAIREVRKVNESYFWSLSFPILKIIRMIKKKRFKRE